MKVRMTNSGGAPRVLYDTKGKMVTIPIGASVECSITEKQFELYRDDYDRGGTLSIEQLSEEYETKSTKGGRVRLPRKTKSEDKQTDKEPEQPADGETGNTGPVGVEGAEKETETETDADKQSDKTDPPKTGQPNTPKVDVPVTALEILAKHSKGEYPDYNALLTDANKVLDRQKLGPRPKLSQMLQMLRDEAAKDGKKNAGKKAAK